MSESRPAQFVAVFDFGAQYGQLIARRVRDLHVYSEIVPCDISADELAAMAPSAIILSGGPASVYADDAPDMDERVFSLGIPIFGFCYGQQIMAVTLGGAVGAQGGLAGGAKADYGSMSVPSVWRTNRTQAAARVDALSSGGMDDLEIPAFLRKQAD